MPSLIVFDSSAILAVLRNERGADVVIDNLDYSVISAVNLGEVVQVQMRDGHSRAEVEISFNQLNVPVAVVDADLALSAAEMRAMALAKGMSQSDCICLALAKREGVPALTGDRKWLEIAETVGVEVLLIR
jgi:ribonuclease VapC